jgi:hypothetical protein
MRYRYLKIFRKWISLSHYPFLKVYTLSLLFYLHSVTAKILWEGNETGTFTYVCVCCLFQCDAGQYSDMQFCSSDHKTGRSTQRHNAMWACEFCPNFFTFHRMHETSIFSSFLWKIFTVPYIILRSDGWWKGWFFFPMWSCLWLQQPSPLVKMCILA